MVQKNHKNNTLMSRILIGVLSCLIWTVTQATSAPLWTIVPTMGSNPTRTVLRNETSTVQYIVQNQSDIPKNLVMQPIRGITQTTPCRLAPAGQAGSSCILILAINGSQISQDGVQGGPILCQSSPDGSPNPNQCYQPSKANSLNISMTVPPPIPVAIISVNPQNLILAENSTGEVTVTNSALSPVTAENVTMTIPAGSNISVQSTTCPASLAIGASCTITIATGTQEGPTTLTVSGDNTNAVPVNVTVTDQPQISISGPAQQDRVVTVSDIITPLSLEITNNGGSNANGITVTNHAACPNLFVSASNCISVAPGDTCNLELTSPTPYEPCMITISGSNTANSPQTLIAFFHEGGLVFEESAGSGKVVIDVSEEFISSWTSSQPDAVDATSEDDGAANTDIIVNYNACSNDPDNCAAWRCRDIDPVWYLPAINELSAVHSALCSNATSPCNFGMFADAIYWSSTQGGVVPVFDAFGVTFPDGTVFSPSFEQEHHVRCIRTFP